MSNPRTIEHLASNQRAGGSNPSGCTKSPSREQLASEVLGSLFHLRDPWTVYAVAGLVAPERSVRIYDTGWPLTEDADGTRSIVVAFERTGRNARCILEVPVSIVGWGLAWTAGEAHIVRVQWDRCGQYISLLDPAPVELLWTESRAIADYVRTFALQCEGAR